MKSVLIIEDEPSIRKIIKDELEGKFKIFEASNGEVGLDLALKNKPNLILLDLLMPKMGGHKMLETLRKDLWGKKVPVIVLTNQDDVHNIAEAHSGQINDYIIKSNSSLEDLKKKVKVAVLTAT